MVSPLGVSLAGGASLVGGPPSWGVPPSVGSPSQGVYLARGCLLLGGSPWWGVEGIPACPEADPTVNRITHSCKNITLATTSLRQVTTMF